MRAVVDTNVWISGLITPHGSRAAIIAALRAGMFEPVFCLATLEELRASCLKPRLARKYGIGLADATELSELLVLNGVAETDPVVVPICRDPRDDIFIALAVASGADYLVTGDHDIKDDDAVTKHLVRSSTRVATIREFLGLLDSD